MKKLLAIILTVVMVISVMCVNTLAVSIETAVWTQDFESAEEDAYDSIFTSGGTSCTGFLQTDAVSVAGATSDKVAAAQRTNNNDASIIKVYVDNSVLEEGATYKFAAKVKHVNSSGNRGVGVRVLKDAGYNEYVDANNGGGTKNTTVTVDTWTNVYSNEFIYNKANVTEGSTLNVRFQLSKNSADTTEQLFYVDDVKLIKVVTMDETLPTVTGSVFESYELGKVWDFENLTYNTLRHTNHDTDQDTDQNGIKYIVDDPTGAENKVLLGAGAATTITASPRNELIGFLANEDVKGDTYRISYKLYPAGTSTLNIRTGLKGEKGSTTGSISGIQLVNGTDFVANQWNDISFTIQAGTDNAKNLFFDQRVGSGNSFVSTNSFDYLYIDDIKIELVRDAGKTYFQGMATDTAQIRDFEDNPALVNGMDYKSGSTGYGEISIANEGYNSNYSLKISGRTVVTGRYKLLDVFKDATVGSMYKISAYFKIADTDENASKYVSIGVMSNEVYHDMHYNKVEAAADGWTKCELIYIVSTDSSGNKMDEISIEQAGISSSATAIDTIYIDNLTVEPVTDEIATGINEAFKKSGSASADYIAMAVKFGIDAAAFESADSPVMIIAAYNSEGSLVGTDVVAYDGTSTEYIGYVDGLTSTDISSAKVFMWNGADLTPVSDTVILK